MKSDIDRKAERPKSHHETRSSASSLQEMTEAVRIPHDAHSSKLTNAQSSYSGPTELRQERSETDSSSIFVWGNNSYGQLSLSTNVKLIQDPIAIRLDTVGRIKAVACGDSHTLLVSQLGGVVFSMGDNTCGQLGVPSTLMKSSRKPLLLESFSLKDSFAVATVECASNSSFVMLQAQAGQVRSDKVYSWGSTKHGILGHEQLANQTSVETPVEIEFPGFDDQNVFQIEHFSVGYGHAAIVTKSHVVLTWGSNEKGQLGLGDTHERLRPTLNHLTAEKESVLVSCGTDYTFLISGANEILVSGKLPFMVKSEDEDEKDHIDTFQSIAQFDQRVKICQVETSRFTSIVVDPVEDEQPKELFLWGQSPLGVFNELMPLNQLFSGSFDSPEEGSQIFNIRAVRNGLNFCVFIDETTGMTFQIGAENLIDPYVDDALVSLSELRDAQFGQLNKFACGQNFVIGESIRAGSVTISSPMKQVSKVKAMSPVKETIQEEAGDMSLQMVSPDGSKQSFPKRALYQGSISPSTPTDTASMQSFSGQQSSCINFKFQHPIQKITSCCSSRQDTPKGKTQVIHGAKSCLVNDHTVKPSEEETSKITMIEKNKALLSKTTTFKGLAEEERQETAYAEKPEAVSAIENPMEDETNKSKTSKEIDEDTNEEKFRTQMKSQKHPMFSPDVSPINEPHELLRDSSIADQNWIDGYPSMSGEKAVFTDRQAGRQHLEAESFQKCERSSQIHSQMPLQMQTNSHQVYQQVQAMTRINERSQYGATASYLPVQLKGGCSQQSTPRSKLMRPNQSVSVLNGVYVGSQNQMLNQSQLNCSGFLNLSQHQQQLADQQSFYEQMMKEKIETAQLKGQLIEAQRQLDRSRKDYAKLLSQVDEDQEQTSYLIEMTRVQETKLSELSTKLREHTIYVEKLVQEKSKLDFEVRQTSKAFGQLQAELKQEQVKVKDLLGKSQGECKNQACKTALAESETQLQKKSKLIYDLTVKLGCIELENKELKVQLHEKEAIFEQRLDSSRVLADQEIQETQSELQDLQEALAQANLHIKRLTDSQNQRVLTQNEAVQTDRIETFDQSAQVGVENELEEQSAFETSLPEMPRAVFETIIGSRELEEDTSFDAEISEQVDNTQELSSESIAKSLEEFRCIEKATMLQRQSMDLPRQTPGAQTHRISVSRKDYSTCSTSMVDEQKPKHNFMGARDPKILRKSDQRCISKRQLVEKPELIVDRRTSHQQLLREHNLDLKAHDSIASTSNFPSSKAVTAVEQSSLALENQSLEPDAEQSWQTFKPITSNPNDRYSLRRHQEMFMESQASQQEETEMCHSSTNICSQAQTHRQPVTQRRAKSNSDAGALQMVSQKVRRLRHQRKAQASSRADGDSLDNTSNHSFGSKSNLTMTILTERSSQFPVTTSHKHDDSHRNSVGAVSGHNKSLYNDSRLQKPTHLTKSPALRATLSKLETNQRSQKLINGQQYPMTTRNSVKPSMAERQSMTNQPSQTLVNINSQSGYFAASSRDSKVCATARNVHSTRPTLEKGINHSSQTQTVTPRVKSQSNLHGNTRNTGGRSSKQSEGKLAISAQARRVAYDHRRKLAFQSMKQMTKSPNQAYQIEVNRQARRASANAELCVQNFKSIPLSLDQSSRKKTTKDGSKLQCITKGEQLLSAMGGDAKKRRNDSSLLFEEQPFANPPQQAKKPEMSVMEESDFNLLMSGRASKQATANGSQQSSAWRNTLSATEPQNQAMDQSLNSNATSANHNPFLATPCSGRQEARHEWSRALLNVSQQQPATSPQSMADQSGELSQSQEEKIHLSEMKGKLHQIQSNKMMLEQKILEYEAKLKEISQEKSTQEIFAKHKRRKSNSMENVQSDQNGSDYTLGCDSSRVKYEKQTPRHIFSTQERQERQNRKAFQQLNSHANTHNTTPQPLIKTDQAYRQCFIAPPRQPPSRMKAPASVMPNTHYANQSLFQR